MSALAVQPALQPAPRRSGGPRRRGNLQLVGPGFVPEVSAPVVPVRPTAAGVPTRRPVRLTALGRGLLAGIALLIATAAAVGLGVWAAGLVSSAATESTTVVTVGAGETLWSVATGFTAPGEDVRDVVAEIAELNAMTTSDLRAGQQLVVPAS